jgi:hypothetical protein
LQYRPGDDEGAVDDAVPAEHDRYGNTRDPGSRAVSQELQGTRGEKLPYSRESRSEGEEDGGAADTTGPDRRREVKACAQDGVGEDELREPRIRVVHGG